MTTELRCEECTEHCSSAESWKLPVRTQYGCLEPRGAWVLSHAGPVLNMWDLYSAGLASPTQWKFVHLVGFGD